jgi:curved DNA-binding protein CbpA
VQGQLGEKLIADLIREIAQKNQSGLLRLTRGKAIKAIFFESGRPVFAISNLLNEQLDHRLIHDGVVTGEQVGQAKARAGKANRIATALVEMGAVTEGIAKKLVRQQVMEIVLSVFEWHEGDYAFDERIRASHEVTIDVSATDVLLEGGRHAAGQQVALTIAPQTAFVVRAKSGGFASDSGKLLPVESYVLSRIESPTAVADVGALSGIADEDAHRSVCALIAAGFLKVLDQGSRQAEPDQPREEDDDVEQLRREISRKIHFFTSADYYEILGVGRQAAAADIKAAYYQLAKKFHPDRYRQPEHADIRSKLEALFTLITQAYETLSESRSRMAYDDRLRKSPAQPPPASLKTTPLIMPESMPQEVVAPAEDRKRSAELSAPAPQPKSSGSLNQPKADPPAVEQNQQRNTGISPAQQAEQYYKQGRALFERKEYHSAVHLLRESVKLDPTRAPYHFHLGIALIRNPRTRREATDHLTKAAELEPYNAQIRVKMGQLYKEAGLAKKAETYFREALELDPENRAAKRELAAAPAKDEHASIWKSDLGSFAKRLFKK